MAISETFDLLEFTASETALVEAVRFDSIDVVIGDATALENERPEPRMAMAPLFIEFGEPAEIEGLKISSGDLLHGDRHGAIIIPLAIASEIPEAASLIRAEERELIEFCGSAHFSLQELSQRMQGMSPNCDLPWPRR